MMDPVTFGEALFKSFPPIVGPDGVIKESKDCERYATGIIAAFKAATCVHPRQPKTIDGAGVPNGGPFTGRATQGKILNLSDVVMTEAMTADYPKPMKENTFALEAKGVCEYLMSAGVVVFDKITGTCAATSEAPGMLEGGAGVGGRITALKGDAMQTVVGGYTGAAGGVTVAWYEALCQYLMQMCEVTYPPGAVRGEFPSGGGAPLTAEGVGGVFA